MKFEEFEAGFIRENRKLKLYLIAIAGVLIACLGLILSERRYFIYSGGEIFQERLLAVDICREGFTQIVTGKPTDFFVTDGILKILKKTPFLFDNEQTLLLKAVEEGKCRLIARHKGKAYSFLITLQASKAYPFYYKVNQIDQVEVEK